MSQSVTANLNAGWLFSLNDTGVSITMESNTYALFRTDVGWICIDPLNNSAPIEVLEQAILNNGVVLAESKTPQKIDMRSREASGYVYCLTYIINGIKMIKVGRSSNETRATSYRHMDNMEIIFNVKVTNQISTEKGLLRLISNGRNEYIPYSNTAIKKAKEYVGI